MEIRTYLAILQRWLWLILLGAAIAGGITYVVNINTTPIYRTSSRLLIDEAPGSNSGNAYTEILVEQRLATTYVELIKGYPVLEETISRLDLPLTASELSGRLSISAPAETQLISIIVEDSQPQRAVSIANTLATVFSEQNEARQNARYQEPIANWESRMTEIRDEIATLETQKNRLEDADTPEDEAALSALETALREAEISYTEAFNNLEQLRVEQAKGTNNLILVEEARLPQSPIRPRPVTNALLGAILGGLVALGFVFTIEYLDDTIKSPEQIEEQVGLSTLGAIAMISGDEMPERLVTHLKPRAPISEAYRLLRTNLSFSAIDDGLQTLLVTSASPGEGKSTTVANLAVVMAQTGQDVIVVDSDLRRPTQHKLFSLPNNQGLTTALLDNQTPVRDHFQKTRIANLKVMTSGPIPPNPAELLNSQRMSQVITALRKEAAILIFDAPPGLTVADASILAPQLAACILVAHVGKTRLQSLQQVTQNLVKANANLIGVVLNQVKLSRSGYYNYYFYRYYNYEYGEPTPKTRLPAWLSALGKR